MSLTQSIKSAQNISNILKTRITDKELDIVTKSQIEWIDETINRLSNMLSSNSISVDSDCVKNTTYNLKRLKNETKESMKSKISYYKHCEEDLLSELSDIDFYIKRLSGKKKEEYSYHVINNNVDKIDVIINYLKEKNIQMVNDKEEGRLYFIAKKWQKKSIKEQLLFDFGDDFNIVSVIGNMGTPKTLKVLKNNIHKELLGI